MFDLERFVEDCLQAVAERDGQKAVREVLQRAVSAPHEVIKALGEPKEAGLATLHASQSLTILNVTWAPLMTLMPHNHNDNWAAIGIYTGREDNIYWRRNEGAIKPAGADALSEREVLPLGKNIIHSVINPIPRLTGAIHIYGGDFFAEGKSEWDPETLRERPYDPEKTKRLFTEANERFKV